MSISLVDLESAAKSIAEIGRDEVTFNVEGTSVTLRTLFPDEEIEVQRYAIEAYETGASDSASFLDYCDRFRLAILSASIIKLGSLDLRGVSMVETGEKLENGVVIKVPKDQALRTLLKPWDRAIKKRMFSRHTTLADKAAHRALEAIETGPSDLETQIAFHKSRVAELEGEVAQRKDEDKQVFQVFYDAVVAQGQKDEEVQEALTQTAPPTPEPAVVPPEPTQAPEPVVVTPLVSAPRKSIIPTGAAPPPPIAAPVPAPAPAPVQVKPTEEPTDPLSNVRSSFQGADDLDALEEETRRFYENRMAAQRGDPVEGLSRQVQPQTQARHVPLVEQVRPAPHLAAQKVEGQVGAMDVLQHNQSLKQAQIAQEMQGPQQVHSMLSGEEVFAMPSEPLTHRQVPKTKKVEFNKVSKGYRNPRFQSRKK